MSVAARSRTFRLTAPALVAALIVVLWHLPTGAATKVALVIGNNNYTHAPQLSNPVNDAKAVAAVLRAIEFDVIEHYDVTMSEVDAIMESFARRTSGAEIGLVYFAGHGIQVSGSTYLVPVDVSLQSDRDMRKLIPADYFLQDASQARTVGVVILDACRDNPFIKRLSEATAQTRSVTVGRGLSRIDDVPKKGLIAYATQAGNVALDTTGGSNSPYAAALVKHLGAPNKDIRLVFGAIRDEVIEVTRRRQEPYTYGSLGGDPIYLHLADGTANESAPAQTPESAQTPDAVSFIPTEQLATSAPVTGAYIAWKSAVESSSWDALTLLSRSPEHGVFPMLAGHLAAMRAGQAGLTVAEAIRRLEDQKLDHSRMAPAFATLIQEQLRDLNYFGGDVDGRFGTDSQLAFNAFVADHRRGQGITAADLVALAEKAAERTAQSQLSGTWRGRYHYPRPVRGVTSVAFEMDLTFSQGRVSGFIAEPNTFGTPTSVNLYATFAGTVMGNHVEWKKTYDGTGGVAHSVWYRGTLDRRSGRIEGRWMIKSDWAGDFNIELSQQ